MFSVTVEESLPIKFGFAYVKDVIVKLDELAFNKLKEVAKEYKAKYFDTPIGKIENVKYARKLFHSIGLDPTKYRPSSEALLNRALKGKEFYSINNLVDVGNWCSLEFLLPICVYDADKVVGKNLYLRIGRSDDGYLALNDRFVNLENKILISDQSGAFGSPLNDSKRTAVDLNTKNTLLGIYAPADYPTEELKRKIYLFSERVTQFCNGTVEEVQIVP